MNKWYSHIIINPITHKALCGYNGDFPHEIINELLKDCVCCETNDIICYVYYDLICEHMFVELVNKHNPRKYFSWVCGQSIPKFKIIDNVIYAKSSLSSYIVKICLWNTGNIYVESLHVNNWNEIKMKYD